MRPPKTQQEPSTVPNGVPADASSVIPTETCPNCGAKRVGEYCQGCGQHYLRRRLTLRVLWQEFAERFFKLERGLLRTMHEMTTDPGGMISRYVGGQRRSYLNPFSYVVLSSVLTVLIFQVAGIQQELADLGRTQLYEQISAQGNTAPPAFIQLYLDFIAAISRYSLYTTLAMAIPFALLLRLWFYKSRYNVAEHFVFVLFCFGHVGLLISLLFSTSPTTSKSRRCCVKPSPSKPHSVRTALNASCKSSIHPSCQFMTAARCLLLLMLCWMVGPAQAQQVGDTLFVPVMGPTTYEEGTGPRVLIDEAHHNFHTATGRYRPFADVLRRDGYVVASNERPFTLEALADAEVLVIANALNERNLGNWALPSYAAFTPAEVEAVYAWVEGGGALFLIADHMPFPGAANELAGAFGFRFVDGFAIDTTATCAQCPLPFRADNGSLRPHAITQDIDSVATFTGQAFLATVGDVEPLLVLGPGATSLLPQQAWQFDDATPHLSSGGWLQGAVRQVGAGRVAVFGEAAMFTAQRAGPDGDILIGMSAPEAAQNARFLQQVMRWLTVDDE